jgi:hypothetical protein
VENDFGFKKVGEDKNTITLKHPKGHELKINKSAALNLGQGVNASQEAEKLGAMPQKFADGTPDEPIPEPTADTTSTAPPGGGGWSIGSLISGLFGGGNDSGGTPNPSPSQQPAIPPDQTQAQANPPSLQSGPSNYNLGAPQQQQQGVNPNPMPDPDQFQGNMDQYQQGLRQEAQAEGKMGQMKAQAAGQNIAAQQQNMEEFQTRSQHFMDEADKAAHDAGQSHVDPEMGAHSGLGTAIGLILGGIGGGITGQENPVLKYLNAEKERSIQSQVANMGNKQNMVGVYTKLLGNTKDATDMVSMMNNSILANKFEQAAGQAADPQAKARALQAASLYRNQNYPIAQQMTIRRQLLGQMNQQGQGGAQNPAFPAIASRFVSPDSETNKAAQGEIKGQQNINSMNSNAIQSFDRVASMQTLGNRLGSPVQSQRRINAEWEPMMDKLTKNNEGRVTPITVDLMSSLKPELADNAQTVAEKREKLMNILNSERSTPTLDSIGVQVPKNIGVARTNPNAPQGYKVANR